MPTEGASSLPTNNRGRPCFPASPFLYRRSNRNRPKNALNDTSSVAGVEIPPRVCVARMQRVLESFRSSFDCGHRSALEKVRAKANGFTELAGGKVPFKPEKETEGGDLLCNSFRKRK